MTTGRINQVTTVQKIRRNRPVKALFDSNRSVTNTAQPDRRIPQQGGPTSDCTSSSRHISAKGWSSSGNRLPDTSITVPNRISLPRLLAFLYPHRSVKTLWIWQRRGHLFVTVRGLLQGYRHAFNIPLTNTRTTIKLHSTGNSNQNCSFIGRLTYSDSIHSQWAFTAR